MGASVYLRGVTRGSRRVAGYVRGESNGFQVVSEGSRDIMGSQEGSV